MNTTVAVTFLLIVLARITDVTLDTIRTAAIVQGRRAFAAVLGFFQAEKLNKGAAPTGRTVAESPRSNWRFSGATPARGGCGIQAGSFCQRERGGSNWAG